MSTTRTGSLVLALSLTIPFLSTGCSSDPTQTTSTSVTRTEGVPTTETPDTTVMFLEPPIPDAGGVGLPDSPDGSTDDEIDCDNAEELCDSGEWACDDIADYCDIGPDGGELPDDWDWDS
jgi:hypothetical protein